MQRYRFYESLKKHPIEIINLEINANDIIVKNTATYAKNKLEEEDTNEEIS